MDTMSPALPDFAKALAKRLLETQPEEVVARRRKHGHVLRNLPVEGVPAQEASVEFQSCPLQHSRGQHTGHPGQTPVQLWSCPFPPGPRRLHAGRPG